MSFEENFTPSSLPLNSSEDWDRSDGEINPLCRNYRAGSTPRSSVVFPGGGVEDTPRKNQGEQKEGRLLSELISEKGTDVAFSPEEASRVADVLKQWINSEMSPYEGEDDFFSQSQDDSLLESKQSSQPPMEMKSRSCGQSESLTLTQPTAQALDDGLPSSSFSLG